MNKTNISVMSVFGEPSIGVWESDRFVVAAFQNGDATRLSVVRRDFNDGIGWDELQAVKNECGFENKDAVEFYPAQKDVINTGNIRHLYIFAQRLPFIRRSGD